MGSGVQRLCRLDELPDNQGKGAEADIHGETARIVLVRRGNSVFGYRNVCPHRGTSLDWEPDRFMSPDGKYLQCASHGALFEPESGRCVAGPCRGRGLSVILLSVVDGWVTVTS